MLNQLIKLANKLDAMGEHDLADELDAICREAATPFVDKRPESERQEDSSESPFEAEMLPRIQKELKSRPGESDPRRVLVDEEGTHEEDRSEPVPEERMKPMLPGKRVDVSPEELSEEDPSDKYLETRVEDIEDFRDPERDLLVELLERMPNKKVNPYNSEDDVQDNLDMLWGGK